MNFVKTGNLQRRQENSTIAWNNWGRKKGKEIKRRQLRLTGRYMLRRPSGGSGSVRLGHSAALHSHASLRHILPALAFAAQSPCPGRQNVIYRRNVRRNAQMVNKIWNILKIIRLYKHWMYLKQRRLIMTLLRNRTKNIYFRKTRKNVTIQPETGMKPPFQDIFWLFRAKFPKNPLNFTNLSFRNSLYYKELAIAEWLRKNKIFWWCIF
jgi:hypothetical protein